MKKRMIVTLLVAAMLLNVCPVFASAAQTASIVVDPASAVPGGTVDVVIRLENNPGITSMKLDVFFAEGLTLTDVTYNSAIGGQYMKPENMDKVNTNHKVILNWFAGLQDVTGDWWFAKLTFCVVDSAALGEYPITVTYDENDVFNLAEQNVHFHVTNGTVTVKCAHKNPTEVPAHPADCEHDGNYAYYVCDCGVVLKADGVTETTEEAEVIPALGHDWANADCDSPSTCKRCGATSGAAIGHAWDDGVVTTPATCEKDGVKTYTCKNDPSHTYTEVIPATGHTPGKATQENYKEATCETDGGYDEVVSCTGCGKELSRTHVTLPATSHDWDDGVVTTPATCEKDGVKTYTCKNDPSHTYTEVIPATGHGDSKVTQENYKEATCETDGGYDEVVTCGHCGKELSRTHVTLPATGHAWDDGVVTTPATCEKDGVKTYTCKNDPSHTYTEVIPATGHDWGKGEYHAPTCTEDGYTVYTCAHCGKTRKDVDNGSALGHDFVNGECTHCGAKEFMLGDINMDGEVDIFDANLAAAYFNEVKDLTADQLLAGDVNGDGEVDIFDANLIAAYFNEVIDKFPAEN